MIQIESLKKVKLEDGDVLLVEVDIGAMPASRSRDFLEQVQGTIKAAFGDVRCLVIPLHRVRVSVLNVEEAVTRHIDMKDKMS